MEGVGIAAAGLLALGTPGGGTAAVAAAMAAPLTVLLLWTWGQYLVKQLAGVRSSLARGAGPEPELYLRPAGWSSTQGSCCTTFASACADSCAHAPLGNDIRRIVRLLLHRVQRTAIEEIQIDTAVPAPWPVRA